MAYARGVCGPFTSKDQQIEAMRQNGVSLQKQKKQVWGGYLWLVAVLGKERAMGMPGP